MKAIQTNNNDIKIIKTHILKEPRKSLIGFCDIEIRGIKLYGISIFTGYNNKLSIGMSSKYSEANKKYYCNYWLNDCDKENVIRALEEYEE